MNYLLLLFYLFSNRIVKMAPSCAELGALPVNWSNDHESHFTTPRIVRLTDSTILPDETTTMMISTTRILESSKCQVGSGDGGLGNTDYQHLFSKMILQNCKIIAHTALFI